MNIIKTTKIIAITLALVTINAFGFNYPTAIPNAWIDPDITAPSSPEVWDTELAGKYYIDNTNPDCVDRIGTVDTNGSRAVPRCTLVRDVPEGSYIEVGNGTYSYTTKVYIKSSGTSENPVWMVSGENTVMELSLVLYGTYLYVDGFTFLDDNGVSVRPYQDVKTDHILFRNSTITGNGTVDSTTGFSAEGDKSFVTSDIIAYNNKISYMGDSTSRTVEGDNHALQTGSHINNVWYLYNDTHHNSGDGVQFSHGGVNAHNFYYGGNTSHSEHENCVDVKTASNIIISDNLCYDIRDTPKAEGGAMVAHYDSDNVWWINNDISDANHGIILNGVTNQHIIGNTIYNMFEYTEADSRLETHNANSAYNSGAGITMRGVHNVNIENNYITDVSRGIAWVATGPAPTPDLTITGNIIENLRYSEYNNYPPLTYVGYSESDSARDTEDGLLMENNIFHNPTTLRHRAVNYYDLESFIAGTGKCSIKCSSDDPLLDENHRPLEGSFAIDNGVVAISYGEFESEMYSGVYINVDGNNYDRSINPDIGVWETNGNYIPREPTAPTSMYIDVVSKSLRWLNKSPDLTNVQLIKNGEILPVDIDEDASDLYIEDINESKDTYQIKVTNSLGNATTRPVSSDVVNVLPIEGNMLEVAENDKSWYLPRTALKNTRGLMEVFEPTVNGTAYGTGYSKTKVVDEDGVELSTGYIYILNKDGDSIKGTVSGSGVVDIYTINTSYDEDTSFSEFSFNDSVIKFDTTRSFKQNRISIDVDGQLNYEYSPSSYSDKSAIGIGAIIEQ